MSSAADACAGPAAGPSPASTGPTIEWLERKGADDVLKNGSSPLGNHTPLEGGHLPLSGPDTCSEVRMLLPWRWAPFTARFVV